MSFSNVLDIDEKIENATLSVFLFQNKKKNWSAAPHVPNTGQIGACNIVS